MERSGSGGPEETIEEAVSGRQSEHERRVEREREDRGEVDQGRWPGEPGDPPGAAVLDDSG
jgi:hypothetical protein